MFCFVILTEVVTQTHLHSNNCMEQTFICIRVCVTTYISVSKKKNNKTQLTEISNVKKKYKSFEICVMITN